MQQINHEYWLIRHPNSDGSVIAKFDTAGKKLIPKSIAEYDKFVIDPVYDRAELAQASIDQSGLSSSEKGRLRDVFSILG
jgi:hypothetical protein